MHIAKDLFFILVIDVQYEYFNKFTVYQNLALCSRLKYSLAEFNIPRLIRMYFVCVIVQLRAHSMPLISFQIPFRSKGLQCTLPLREDTSTF